MRLDESFGFRIELVLRSVACVHFERYRIYTFRVLARRRPTTFLTVTASLLVPNVSGVFEYLFNRFPLVMKRSDPRHFFPASLTHSSTSKGEYDEFGPTNVHRKCFLARRVGCTRFGATVLYGDWYSLLHLGTTTSSLLASNASVTRKFVRSASGLHDISFQNNMNATSKSARIYTSMSCCRVARSCSERLWSA